MIGPPDVERIVLPSNGERRWAGMATVVLVSPDGRHEVALTYVGEPPHGDSDHRATIDGVSFPGLFWGCLFAFTGDCRFFTGSWMPRLSDRLTVVVDVDARTYCVLPPDAARSSAFLWPILDRHIVPDGVSSSPDVVSWTTY